MYQWFVFIHLVGLVLFVFAHGASAFTTFQIRTMQDPDVIRGYLRLSQEGTRAGYVGLLLLLVGGAGAATINGFWSEPWVWGSVIVLLTVLVVMYAVGSPYYTKLRRLLAGSDGQPPLTGEALTAYLDSRRPDILGGVGALGFVVLVWLMVMKPG
jgi:hypothetical protein